MHSPIERKPIGVYIHVPFCTVKCRYCDFYSVISERSVGDYLRALHAEIEERLPLLQAYNIRTIYFGGGTPSILPAEEVTRVIRHLIEQAPHLPEIEVTIECNPGDEKSMCLDTLVSGGVNRFSIGAQSFSPQTLQTLGRRHTPQETITLVETLREKGIDNISLDLMYGIPGTTLKMLNRDLDKLLEIHPEHISAYHLIYEPGTPLFYDRAKKRISELSEERSLEMMHLLESRLCNAGYEHYEISNYALPHKHSKHNSGYWQELPYIGLGPSAHSFIAEQRTYNPSNIREYVSHLTGSEASLSSARIVEERTEETRYEEYILTRLRTADGISPDEITERCGREVAERLGAKLLQLVQQELLYRRETDGRYALTRNGIDISDTVMLTLFDCYKK